ncbi:prepilin peptidase [Mucilaginibacter psychrotolerans]|uniref:Prepilin type IV endopeptidase peptidase domain-containing protein n=1 Tax=Mucilaginibacter psychrotolerans TaxID=1524096 RepID=A0A4Y8SB15_9SPHI|nr:prepilin peptidase [Mucilaginibacter psychrotolerans]TFF36209.1 hypothetical protein E2R66_16850 [Mucilaginibacter psychrotolerans]
MQAAKIVTLIILVIMFVQDIKSRSIAWPLFPALAVLFVIIRFAPRWSFSGMVIEVAGPLICLSFMLTMVSLYISARYRKWIWITDEMLGWADVLFLACLAFYLPLLNYMLFFIASSIVILLSWLVYQLMSPVKSKFIPFAGCQALLLGGLLVISWLSPFDITSDLWFIKLATR